MTRRCTEPSVARSGGRSGLKPLRTVGNRTVHTHCEALHASYLLRAAKCLIRTSSPDERFASAPVACTSKIAFGRVFDRPDPFLYCTRWDRKYRRDTCVPHVARTNTSPTARQAPRTRTTHTHARLRRCSHLLLPLLSLPSLLPPPPMLPVQPLRPLPLLPSLPLPPQPLPAQLLTRQGTGRRGRADVEK